MAGRGGECLGRPGKVSWCVVRSGMEWPGKARQAGLGLLCFGIARKCLASLGLVWQAWRGEVSLGKVRPGRNGVAGTVSSGPLRRVGVGSGVLRQAGLDMVMRGGARHGTARQMWSQKGGNNLVYQFKIPGIFPVSAQTAGEELHRIYESKGCLDPKDVVDESRPEEAPLHSCFEWDDETSAEKYREVQAGQIIRSVVVVQEEKQRPQVEVRAFVSVQKTYRPIEVVVNSEEQMLELFNSALSELKAFERKYANLKQFSALFDEIHKLTA